MALVGWVVAHFLLWDYEDTQPIEEFNLIRQYNFFTNPNIALENVYITVGQVISFKNTNEYQKNHLCIIYNCPNVHLQLL